MTFTAGQASRGGPSLIHGDLCEEARWLGSLVVRVAPDPEVLALQALMDFTDARRPGRLDADGGVLLMEHQDRSRWDRALIRRGQEHLAAAMRQRRLGSFQVQAVLAACHTLAPTWEATDWTAIAHWYDVLLRFDDRPVTRLNRAVALGFTGHPEQAATELTALTDTLADSPYLWTAWADIHTRLGHRERAHEAWTRAEACGLNADEAAAARARLNLTAPDRSS
ncbi:MAG: DUF6596 domain-containing protein [Propioniciclava sp.]